MKKKKYAAPVFTYLYYLFLIVFLIILMREEKGSLELLVNNYHNVSADIFFKSITHLGSGAVVTLPIIALLFVRYSYSILLAWATLFHAIVVILFKKFLFNGTPRPAEFFSDIPFYEVPGVSVHHWDSFPSGHTASAFMLACVFAMIFSKKGWIQFYLLIAAALIGFSRVYLMQHFFVDVMAGSLVGVWSAFAARWITLSYFSSKKFKRSLYPKRKVVSD